MKLLSLVALLLSSCVYGYSKHLVSLGGKGAYKGSDFSLVWNHEKSFRDGAVAAGLAIGAIQTSVVTKSNNALSATKDTNATSVINTTTKTNAAVETARINANTAVTTKAIDAGVTSIPK